MRNKSNNTNKNIKWKGNKNKMKGKTRKINKGNKNKIK